MELCMYATFHFSYTNERQGGFVQALLQSRVQVPFADFFVDIL